MAPVVGALAVGALCLLTPERSWPPDDGAAFALCIVYVGSDGEVAARYPERGHTAETFLDTLTKLHESGATFPLPDEHDDVSLPWPGVGSFSYHVISVSAAGVQLVRTRCEVDGGEVYKTTYEVAPGRVIPVSYLMGYAWFATTWRVVLVLVLVSLPLFWIGGRGERRHEERRMAGRRSYD